MQKSIGCLLEGGRPSSQPTAGRYGAPFPASRIAQASSARTITYERYLFTSRRLSVTRPESGISVEHASHCSGEMALLKPAGVCARFNRSDGSYFFDSVACPNVLRTSVDSS